MQGPWLPVSLFLLIALCGWMLYKLIDQSVTLDHFAQQTNLVEKQRDLLVKIAELNSSSLSKADLQRFVDTHADEHSVFQKEDGTLVIDQVVFKFRGDILVGVSAGP